MNVSFSFEKKKFVLLLVQRDNHDSSGTLSNEYERKIWYSWKSKILDQNVKVIFFIAQQKSPTDIVYLLIFEKELTKKNTQKKNLLCILRWRWIHVLQKWLKKNITFFSIHRVDSSRLLFLPTVSIPLFEFNFFGPKKPRKEKNYNTLLYSIHELKIVTFFNFYVIPKNICISLRVDSRIQIQFLGVYL